MANPNLFKFLYTYFVTSDGSNTKSLSVGIDSLLKYGTYFNSDTKNDTRKGTWHM